MHYYLLSWDQIMNINDLPLTQLAQELLAQRKRQKLSREDLAAVCGVSTSFIRDAESNPENCSLGKFAKLMNGLGLRIELVLSGSSKSEQVAGLTIAATSNIGPTGRGKAPRALRQSDFGVPDSQVVGRDTQRQPPSRRMRGMESKTNGGPS